MKPQSATQTNQMFLILCILAFAAMVLAYQGYLKAVIFTDHAKTSHTSAISEIDKCFGNPLNEIPSLGTIYGPFTGGDFGRWIEFCSDGGPNNFFRVFECDGEDKIVITQFKQAINRLVNYMTNKNMVLGEALC